MTITQSSASQLAPIAANINTARTSHAGTSRRSEIKGADLELRRGRGRRADSDSDGHFVTSAAPSFLEVRTDSRRGRVAEAEGLRFVARRDWRCSSGAAIQVLKLEVGQS